MYHVAMPFCIVGLRGVVGVALDPRTAVHNEDGILLKLPTVDPAPYLRINPGGMVVAEQGNVPRIYRGKERPRPVIPLGQPPSPRPVMVDETEGQMGFPAEADAVINHTRVTAPRGMEAVGKDGSRIQPVSLRELVLMIAGSENIVDEAQCFNLVPGIVERGVDPIIPS